MEAVSPLGDEAPSPHAWTSYVVFLPQELQSLRKQTSVWYQCICHCVYYISNLQKTSVIPVQLCFVFIYQFKSILQFSTHDHISSENFLILFSPYTIYSIVLCAGRLYDTC